MMSDRLYFLSIRNMVRSVFAEAVTNRLGQAHFRGFTALPDPRRECGATRAA
jgi:protein-tyrosine-phosphatase